MGFLERIHPHPRSHQFLTEVDVDSPIDETDLERRIAHAVAAEVVPEMEEGWIRKDMEESLRRMPATTEDGSFEEVL